MYMGKLTSIVLTVCCKVVGNVKPNHWMFISKKLVTIRSLLLACWPGCIPYMSHAKDTLRVLKFFAESLLGRLCTYARKMLC